MLLKKSFPPELDVILLTFSLFKNQFKKLKVTDYWGTRLRGESLDFPATKTYPTSKICDKAMYPFILK